MKHYDVVIIGGGLVGTSLAVALQKSQLRVALVDARLPAHDDQRIFALNDASCQFLKNLGLWPALQQHATAIHQVHVSQQGKFGAVRLNREDVAASALGYVIPAKYVEQVLNEHVQDRCDLYRPARLIDCVVDCSPYTLCVYGEQSEDLSRTQTTCTGYKQTLSASIIIGADGTNSTVRELLKIKTTTHDYQQRAIVARVTLQRSHHHIAYERFTNDGAIAMLPLTNNECAVIWSADEEYSNTLMGITDAAFLQTLQTTFGYRLGKLISLQQRYQFPLRMLQAETNVIGNCMLIGNAAHTLHPIAAQGFNIALQEVAALADALIQHQENLPALNLQQVSKITQQHINKTMQLSHRLATLFTKNSLIKSVLLQLCMLGFDVVTPLKQKFIKGMMGRVINASRLLLRANET